MGGKPYPGIPFDNFLKNLKQGHIMREPESCSEELYDVMKLCWKSDPEKRPNFPWLESQLEYILSSKRNVIIIVPL